MYNLSVTVLFQCLAPNLPNTHDYGQRNLTDTLMCVVRVVLFPI